MSILKNRLLIGASAVIAMLVGGASAQYGVPCVANGSEVVLCDWGGTGCWQLTSGTGTTGTDAQCATQASACGANLWVGTEGAGTCASIAGNTPFTSTGATWSVQGGTVNCSWGPAVLDADGNVIDKGCSLKDAAWCEANYGEAVSDEVCAAHNAGESGGTTEHWCKWPDGCYRIANPDAQHPENTNLTNLQNCQTYGQYFTSEAECLAAGDTDREYCDWGPCVDGEGWRCGDGGCFELTNPDDPDPDNDGYSKREACVTFAPGGVVTVCPQASLPPAASVRNAGARSRTVTPLVSVRGRVLSVASASQDTRVRVRVINLNGRVVARYNLKPGDAVTLGRKIATGSYVIEARRMSDGFMSSARVTLD